jgi:hypothetical protein
MSNFISGDTFVTWDPSVGLESFKKLYKMVSDGLSAIGMVKTSDTGQVDWDTVTYPASESFVNYEVYRFNDSLQSSKPIFFKLYYGWAIGAGHQARMKLDIGTGSNGSGVITGLSTLGLNVLVPTSNPSHYNGGASLFSSDGSGLGIAIAADNSLPNNKMLLIIDRTRNSDGTPNSDGVAVIIKAENTLEFITRVLDFNGSNTLTKNAVGALYPEIIKDKANTAQQTNGKVPIGPIWVYIPGGKFNRVKMATTIAKFDLGLGGKFTVNYLSTPMKFISLGPKFSGMDASQQLGVTTALWWED